MISLLLAESRSLTTETLLWAVGITNSGEISKAQAVSCARPFHNHSKLVGSGGVPVHGFFTGIHGHSRVKMYIHAYFTVFHAHWLWWCPANTTNVHMNSHKITYFPSTVSHHTPVYVITRSLHTTWIAAWITTSGPHEFEGCKSSLEKGSRAACVETIPYGPQQ